MTLKDAFKMQVEDYYRDTYPREMWLRVEPLLPSGKAALSRLFDLVIRDNDAWKRSVKVPDVVAIERALEELEVGYPELRTVPVALIGDDAVDHREEVAELLSGLVAKLKGWGEENAPRSLVPAPKNEV